MAVAVILLPLTHSIDILQAMKARAAGRRRRAAKLAWLTRPFQLPHPPPHLRAVAPNLEQFCQVIELPMDVATCKGQQLGGPHPFQHMPPLASRASRKRHVAAPPGMASWRLLPLPACTHIL